MAEKCRANFLFKHGLFTFSRHSSHATQRQSHTPEWGGVSFQWILGCCFFFVHFASILFAAFASVSCSVVHVVRHECVFIKIHKDLRYEIWCSEYNVHPNGWIASPQQMSIEYIRWMALTGIFFSFFYSYFFFFAFHVLWIVWQPHTVLCAKYFSTIFHANL